MIVFAKQICIKLGIEPSIQLKKPIRGLPGFTSVQLIEALISTDSIKEAAEFLDYSEGPVKTSIRSLLQPHFPDRKSKFGTGFVARSWKYTLLSEIGYKQCTCCNKVLPVEDFKARAKNTDNLGEACRNCIKAKKSLERHYIQERTPEWSDLELISKFYSNCPKGYHVDHIIPLRGVLISGLHVIENLQYLPAMENIAKNNAFNIEIFNT